MKRAAEGAADAGRRVGGKQGRLGKFGPHAFKVLCPEMMVAKMVGSHGAVVHDIEAQTNSHLQFSPRGEYYPDTRLRILTIFAPGQQLVQEALTAVLEEVVARAGEEQPSKSRQAGDFVDSSGNIIFRCALSKAAAGAVIGTKGERVRSLRETTGCAIDIAREVVDNHQLVTVGGTRDQLLSVIEELNSTVQADVDAAWFTEWAEQRTPGSGDAARRGQRGGGGSAPGGRRSEEHRGCTIFVGHLAQATDAASLEAHFGRFGRVVDADVRTDLSTGRSKGFGFVTFAQREMAEACLETAGDHEIDGRWVDVKRYEEGGSSTPQHGDRYAPREEEARHFDSPGAYHEPWERNGQGGHHGGTRNDSGPDRRDIIGWFTRLSESVPSDYLELDYCISCSLPSSKCGALIGRRGEHVAEVERATGAVVSVSKKDPHEGPDAHRTVSITGQLLSVYGAHMLLMRHYNDEEAQYRASQEGAGPASEIENLQQQLTMLSEELSRVKGGGKGRRH